MTAAKKAIDALSVPPDQRWTPATWVNDDGEWVARGPKRINREPSMMDGESVDAFACRLAHAIHTDDNEAGCDGDQQALADAARMCLAVNLASPLAAVARAAMEWREAFRAKQGARTPKQRIRYGYDVAIARGKLFAALDALEAAAREVTP